MSADDVLRGAYDEARDVEAAIDFMRGCPFVDTRRVSIGGHSVGGIVTVIAAARRRDIAAVVSAAGGITWTQDGVQQGYPAVKALWRVEAPKLTAPVLLLYGRFDTVVPPELGSDLAALLNARGANVTFDVYPGDHGAFPVASIIAFLDQNAGK